jgi:hypothetical protein
MSTSGNGGSILPLRKSPSLVPLHDRLWVEIHEILALSRYLQEQITDSMQEASEMETNADKFCFYTSNQLTF